MASRRCTAKTKAGKRCQARAVKGSDYCMVHEPALAARRAEWRRAGGRSSGKKAALADAAGVDTPAAVKDLLARAIEAVRTGNMDPKTANAIARLCSLQLKAIKETDLARRLDELEHAVLGRGA